MEDSGGVLLFLIILFFVIFIIRIPIIIAKNRGITGSELTTIGILSWVSLIFGITWIIALILSLVWQPKNWVEKSAGTKLDNLEALEKLCALKEKGVLTEAEFQAQKALLLK